MSLTEIDTCHKEGERHRLRDAIALRYVHRSASRKRLCPLRLPLRLFVAFAQVLENSQQI